MGMIKPLTQTRNQLMETTLESAEISTVRLAVIGVSPPFTNFAIAAIEDTPCIKLTHIAVRSKHSKKYQAFIAHEKYNPKVDNYDERKHYLESLTHESESHNNVFDQILENPNIDAIYIALPTTLHAIWSEKAINSGKHVLCEKPATATFNEMQTIMRLLEMKKAASNKPICYLEGVMGLYSPAVDDLKKKLAKTFDKITDITASYDCNFFDFSTDDPAGTIHNLACYPVSILLYLLDIQNFTIQKAQKTTLYKDIVKKQRPQIAKAMITIYLDEINATIKTADKSDFERLGQCTFTGIKNGSVITKHVDTNPWFLTKPEINLIDALPAESNNSLPNMQSNNDEEFANGTNVFKSEFIFFSRLINSKNTTNEITSNENMSKYHKYNRVSYKAAELLQRWKDEAQEKELTDY